MFPHKYRASASPTLLGLGLGFSFRLISSLKVSWRRDPLLDSAIDSDKRYRHCSRLVREVLNSPNHSLPLSHLDRRRHRLRLPVRVSSLLSRNPGLLETHLSRLRPNSQPVPFVRPGHRLRRYLLDEARIRAEHEPIALAKLCKLVMMSKDRVVRAEKLQNVRRDFGLPDDFLCNLIPKYPQFLELVGGAPGESNCFVKLVGWNDEFAKSAIERRAEKESSLTGFSIAPRFDVRLPKGFHLRKEMREWARDWMEMPYVSPYSDASGLDKASPEMEKRSVGRVPVPTIGKFAEEFLLSNACSGVFLRHPGIFYVSLKGGVETAVLREAYEEGRLVDRDPLLKIKERFEEMLMEGWREWREGERERGKLMQRKMEAVAVFRSGCEGSSGFGAGSSSEVENGSNEWFA
ncbi:hypothetical protein QJS10_CPB04g01077 [Acorus calamus]|uniref:PORR domain-containing protein n=1 Tax=Acorus calamus TaxID=4465 RepID=A0AAV9F3H3_ACOCL|nr:hypothetical protein QJS10_CPB04g01077 [Acorus calamus]